MQKIGLDFNDLTIVPGVVVDNQDPENLQRVKATIPGVFDTATMEVEAMPWIYPLNMWGYQSFSLMLPGSKILVLKNEKNYYDYRYIPYYELNANTKSFIKGETDIIMSRSIGHGNAAIYFNVKDGIVAQIGDSKVTVLANGDVEMFSNGTSVKIEGGAVYCGTDNGEYEPMVMGKTLKETLGKLSSDIDDLAEVANGSPYTVHLNAPLLKMSQNLNSGIQDMLSESSNVAR